MCVNHRLDVKDAGRSSWCFDWRREVNNGWSTQAPLKRRACETEEVWSKCYLFALHCTRPPFSLDLDNRGFKSVWLYRGWFQTYCNRSYTDNTAGCSCWRPSLSGAESVSLILPQIGMRERRGCRRCLHTDPHRHTPCSAPPA